MHQDQFQRRMHRRADPGETVDWYDPLRTDYGRRSVSQSGAPLLPRSVRVLTTHTPASTWDIGARADDPAGAGARMEDPRSRSHSAGRSLSIAPSSVAYAEAPSLVRQALAYASGGGMQQHELMQKYDVDEVAVLERHMGFTPQQGDQATSFSRSEAEPGVRGSSYSRGEVAPSSRSRGTTGARGTSHPTDTSATYYERGWEPYAGAATLPPSASLAWKPPLDDVRSSRFVSPSTRFRVEVPTPEQQTDSESYPAVGYQSEAAFASLIPRSSTQHLLYGSTTQRSPITSTAGSELKEFQPAEHHSGTLTDYSGGPRGTTTHAFKRGYYVRRSVSARAPEEAVGLSRSVVHPSSDNTSGAGEEPYYPLLDPPISYHRPPLQGRGHMNSTTDDWLQLRTPPRASLHEPNPHIPGLAGQLGDSASRHSRLQSCGASYHVEEDPGDMGYYIPPPARATGRSTSDTVHLERERRVSEYADLFGVVNTAPRTRAGSPERRREYEDLFTEKGSDPSTFGGSAESGGPRSVVNAATIFLNESEAIAEAAFGAFGKPLLPADPSEPKGKPGSEAASLQKTSKEKKAKKKDSTVGSNHAVLNEWGDTKKSINEIHSALSAAASQRPHLSRVVRDESVSRNPVALQDDVFDNFVFLVRQHALEVVAESLVLVPENEVAGEAPLSSEQSLSGGAGPTAATHHREKLPVMVEKLRKELLELAAALSIPESVPVDQRPVLEAQLHCPGVFARDAFWDPFYAFRWWEKGTDRDFVLQYGKVSSAPQSLSRMDGIPRYTDSFGNVTFGPVVLHPMRMFIVDLFIEKRLPRSDPMVQNIDLLLAESIGNVWALEKKLMNTYKPVTTLPLSARYNVVYPKGSKVIFTPTVVDTSPLVAALALLELPKLVAKRAKLLLRKDVTSPTADSVGSTAMPKSMRKGSKQRKAIGASPTGDDVSKRASSRSSSPLSSKRSGPGKSRKPSASRKKKRRGPSP